LGHLIAVQDNNQYPDLTLSIRQVLGQRRTFGNPKFEYRNMKQIPNLKNQNIPDPLWLGFELFA